MHFRSVAVNVAAAGELAAAILPKALGTGPSAAADVTAGWLTAALMNRLYR